MMNRIGLIFLATLLATVSFGAEPMKLLSTKCEEALALSALPERLRGAATVYVLEAEGYRVSKHGDGAFTCLVTRNHPHSIIPLCFDKPGTKAIMPSELRRGEMTLAGATAEDYMAERASKVQAGELLAPEPGLSYMVSDYNYIFIPPADRVLKIAAHMMYYAPNLTDEDIGGSRSDGAQNTGMPFINDPGIHGMIIAYVEQASNSADVVRHCAGQLPDEPPPPAGGSD